MNREERRQLYGRVRAGIATELELKVFGANAANFAARRGRSAAWKETLRALVATSLPTAKTRNKRKALARARQS